MSTAPLTTAADLAICADPASELAATLANVVRKRYDVNDEELADVYGDFQNAIDAFLTTYAAQVRRAQWQDIATHPKDHFPCLVCHKDHGRMVAFIDVTGAWWPVPAHERLDFEPTHWVPLPERPGSPSSQTDTGDSNG